MLRHAGSNWVDGDRVFDRESELRALEQRVRNGVHTLLTAQRRMGKTSSVRELLRRFKTSGDYLPVFVDLEAALSPENAIAEIGVQCRPLQGVWRAVRSSFG